MSGLVILLLAAGAAFVWPGCVERTKDGGRSAWSYKPLWYTLFYEQPVAPKQTPGVIEQPAVEHAA